MAINMCEGAQLLVCMYVGGWTLLRGGNWCVWVVVQVSVIMCWYVYVCLGEGLTGMAMCGRGNACKWDCWGYRRLEIGHEI